MANEEKCKFTFVSKALPEETFSVLSFQGQEGLSLLYHFELILVSQEDQLDLEEVLAGGATFTIHAEQGDIPIHGILETLEQRQKVDDYTYYRAVLRPKLWWLTLTQHNQIFLDKTFPQFLEAVLKDAGLAKDIDFELKLSANYPEWEYVCQYNESHFDFISHWMERNGVYYYFDHSSETDKVIFTDTSMAHTPMPQGRSFSYYQPSGLEAAHSQELINSFVCSQRSLPQKVVLKDYNYEHPDMSLEAEAKITSKGRGVLYSYEEHFRSLAEGKELAKIRAEEQLCRQRLFMGESTVPCIRPGYTFDLKRHYREDFNDSYLSIEARHEGSQAGYLRSGLGISIASSGQSVSYRNSFTAIPSRVQFRPEQITEKSRFRGTMHAKIDAAGSGKHAELDEQGRYKVILPLDRSGRKDGKASCWLRMATPYAGTDHGMHCPLHKGTEVLLTFIDGDPDRPIIQSAVPNPETPSVVTDTNQTQVRLRSGGGNLLHMEDEESQKRILMHSPTAGSFIRIGYRNDPDDEDDPGDNGDEEHTKDVDDPQGDCMHDNTEGLRAHTEKTLTFESGDFCSIVHGDEYGRVNGQKRHIIDGAVTELVGKFKTDVVGGNVFEGVLGATEEVLIGFKIGLALSGAFELEGPVKGEVGYGWKWTFHEAKEKFHIEEDEVGALRSELIGEINKLIGDHNKLAGNMVDMAASSEHLAAEVSQLAGTTESINANLASLAADEDEMVAASTRAIGEELNAIGERTDSTGAIIQAAGEKTQVLGIKEVV
ncbi:MAG: type VI secretion system Vgr family protein [Desulfohalobiaceae bacterium]